MRNNSSRYLFLSKWITFLKKESSASNTHTSGSKHPLFKVRVYQQRVGAEYASWSLRYISKLSWLPPNCKGQNTFQYVIFNPDFPLDWIKKSSGGMKSRQCAFLAGHNHRPLRWHSWGRLEDSGMRNVAYIFSQLEVEHPVCSVRLTWEQRGGYHGCSGEQCTEPGGTGIQEDGKSQVMWRQDPSLQAGCIFLTFWLPPPPGNRGIA